MWRALRKRPRVSSMLEDGPDTWNELFGRRIGTIESLNTPIKRCR
jgi:hypothetical protein